MKLAEVRKFALSLPEATEEPLKLAAVDADVVFELLEESWRLKAPRQLVTRRDAES